MKPRIVAGVLACTFIATPAMSQTVELGPKLGLVWADMLGDDSGRAEPRRGFTAGGFLTLNVNESFQVQIEGLFTQKGADFSSVDGRFDLKTSYVEIPVLARLSFPDRQDDGIVPYLFAGPVFSFEQDCEVERFVGGGVIIPQDCEDSDFALTRETESFDLGLILGSGWDVGVGAHSFYVEGRFNVGVRSLDDSGREINIRNLTFEILTGFGLALGG